MKEEIEKIASQYGLQIIYAFGSRALKDFHQIFQI